MKALSVWSAIFLSILITQISSAQETFRTDQSTDESLDWYQLEPGKFPPEGSAHYFSGELIQKDHVNRTGRLRVSRTDAQRRSHWDLSVDFRMLPYGSLKYHGAPAALKDIPVGTHLHGWFYKKAPDEEVKTIFHNRSSLEADFTRCFRLEDDFSYYASRNRAWKVAAVNLEEMKLSVFGITLDNKLTEEKLTVFDLQRSTRVWQGKSIASLEDIKPGQVIQLNLTWATLYGPGRVTDLWLDKESQQTAALHQLPIHRDHQKDRGLAGWVAEVDNQKRAVTVTLFDGVDGGLLKEFQPNTSATIVVAEPNLRSYDQVNDRKGGPILAVKDAPKQPGSSGVQVVVQPSLLLEGFRPGRIVRVFPAGWPIISIPLEERLWPARD